MIKNLCLNTLIIFISFHQCLLYFVRMGLNQSAIFQINHRDITCLGKNSNLSEVTIELKHTSLEYGGTPSLVEIKGINSAKISNNNLSYDLNCIFTLASDLNCTLNTTENYLPGKYFVDVPEEIESGDEYSVILQKYHSTNSFTLSEKNYHRFPFSYKEDIALFKEDDKEFLIEVMFGEPILDLPKLIIAGKEVECTMIGAMESFMICHLERDKFPPSKKGTVFTGGFYNVCGNLECTVKVISKIETKENKFKHILLCYILPGLGLLIIVGIIIGITFYCSKNKNNMDYNETNVITKEEKISSINNSDSAYKANLIS